jgi:hypothetical protein
LIEVKGEVHEFVARERRECDGEDKMQAGRKKEGGGDGDEGGGSCECWSVALWFRLVTIYTIFL